MCYHDITSFPIENNIATYFREIVNSNILSRFKFAYSIFSKVTTDKIGSKDEFLETVAVKYIR